MVVQILVFSFIGIVALLGVGLIVIRNDTRWKDLAVILGKIALVASIALAAAWGLSQGIPT